MTETAALLWGEWRRQRKSVLAMGIVSLAVWGLIWALGASGNCGASMDMVAAAPAACLFPLYAFLSSNAFSSEFLLSTDGFLLGLPVGSGKLYFHKYGVNLALFLALSAVNAAVTLPWLTRGPYYALALLFSTFLVSLGLRETLFFMSLLSRDRNGGILALALFPVAFVFAFIACAVLCAPWAYDDLVWLIVSALAALATLCVAFPVFGWWLWTRRVSLHKGTLKPLVIAAACLVGIPPVLYALAYVYSAMDLNTAIQEVDAYGLVKNAEGLTEKVALFAGNAAPAIKKFADAYDTFFSGHITRGLAENLGEGFNQAKKRHWVELALSGSTARRLSILLDDALSTPYLYRKRLYINADQTDYSDILEQLDERAQNFLYCQALAYRLNNDTSGFFADVEKYGKVCDLIGQDFSLFPNRALRNEKYYVAVVIGPDNLEAARHYREFIKRIDIEKYDLYFVFDKAYSMIQKSREIGRGGAEEAFWFTRIPNIFTRHQTLEALRDKVLPLYIPRLRQNVAAWIRWQIDCHKLAREARLSQTFSEIRTKADKLSWRTVRVQEPYGWRMEVINHFFHRSGMEFLKICLALKIYRAQHGEFPKSLSALVPDILLEIPIDPVSGRDFPYQRKETVAAVDTPRADRGDGFTLISPCADHVIDYKHWDESEVSK